MGEAKRRRDKQKREAEASRLKEAKRSPEEMEYETRKCSANSLYKYCCAPEAWNNVRELGQYGFYILGEPLPQKVIDIAHLYNIDPHDLDWHVEAVHGWEPHDEGYDDRVVDAADCLVDSGYLVSHDKEKCSSE